MPPEPRQTAVSSRRCGPPPPSRLLPQAAAPRPWSCRPTRHWLRPRAYPSSHLHLCLRHAIAASARSPGSISQRPCLPSSPCLRTADVLPRATPLLFSARAHTRSRGLALNQPRPRSASLAGSSLPRVAVKPPRRPRLHLTELPPSLPMAAAHPTPCDPPGPASHPPRPRTPPPSPSQRRRWPLLASRRRWRVSRPSRLLLRLELPRHRPRLAPRSEGPHPPFLRLRVARSTLARRFYSRTVEPPVPQPQQRQS